MDDIPDILRSQFKKYIQKRYQKKWEDNTTFGIWFEREERFRSRFNDDSIELLRLGDTSNWDGTLLVHAILYSSHILLGRPNPKDKKIEAYLFSDNYMLQSNTNTADFTTYFKEGDRILCDCNDSLLINFAGRITKNVINLKRRPKVHSQQVYVYACYSDWEQIDLLRDLRNGNYAHFRSASVDDKKLCCIANEVEGIYRALKIENHRIKSMKDILKGMIACSKMKS